MLEHHRSYTPFTSVLIAAELYPPFIFVDSSQTGLEHCRSFIASAAEREKKTGQPPGNLMYRLSAVVSVLCHCMHTGAPRQLLKSGQALLGYLSSLKKEYGALRKLWMALHEHFSECDELRQAARRIRFMRPVELVLGLENIPFAVHPCMVSVTWPTCDSQEIQTVLIVCRWTWIWHSVMLTWKLPRLTSEST